MCSGICCFIWRYIIGVDINSAGGFCSCGFSLNYSNKSYRFVSSVIHIDDNTFCYWPLDVIAFNNLSCMQLILSWSQLVHKTKFDFFLIAPWCRRFRTDRKWNIFFETSTILNSSESPWTFHITPHPHSDVTHIPGLSRTSSSPSTSP